MKRIGLALLCVIVAGSGCSFHRKEVAALSQRQDKYYTDLQAALSTNRPELKAGLTQQLEVSQDRRRTLLEWNRDLAKIQVLLQAGTESKGGQRSLLMEASASDLATLNQFLALQTIDQGRLDALLNLYDAVIKAVAALQKNNQAITQYLTSRNAEFALQSLDVAALAAAITDLRDLRDQLHGAQALSDAAKATQAQGLQKNIEQAREALLQGLKGVGEK